MKTLVVYYSRTGTTKTVAEELQKNLGADIEEISAPEAKLGLLGYLKAGHKAMANKKMKIEDTKLNSAEYDLVLIGTPVWSWTVSSPVRAYIEDNKDSLKKVAFFCTCGSDWGKTFSEMEAISGRSPVATMELKAMNVKNESYLSDVKRFVGELNNNPDGE